LGEFLLLLFLRKVAYFFIEYAGLHFFKSAIFVRKRVQFSKSLSFSMMQCSDKLGLSLELGSFAAGVMISTTDLAQHTLEQVISLSKSCTIFSVTGFFETERS
jgi:Kef-type K+ transport system membrane component KefB